MNEDSHCVHDQRERAPRSVTCDGRYVDHYDLHYLYRVTNDTMCHPPWAHLSVLVTVMNNDVRYQCCSHR